MAIVSFISYKSYIPETWLLGWDDLAPELNFGLNIERSLSSPWQEYQGLGLLGGMGHASDLIRQIFLLIASFAFKTSFIRYLWTFLMLALGPLGVFFFFRKQGEGSSYKFAAFASSIFYVFNYSTLQTFFTPFETFVTFYGFFPWLVLFAQEYLNKGRKSSLFIYLIILILGSTSFYVQTLFVVYVIFLAVFCLEAIFLRKNGFLRSLILGVATFVVSAYWLLPVGYYAIKNSSVPTDSHINSIATPETQLMNKARGDFSSIASLKGYWFDYYDWDALGNYDLMYKDYISYTSQNIVLNTLIVLFAVSVLGILTNLFVKNKDKQFKVSYLFLLFVCYFMLAGDNKPFGQIYLLLQNNFPVFAEIFRNSFTKWSIPTSFLYAVGVGYFVSHFSGIFKGKTKVFFAIALALLFACVSMFTLLPVAKDGLISKTMKIDLPSDYEQVIKYFKNQPIDGRIASFPLTDFWGWKFNSWGYRGSGFLWYGVQQPILDRAFDVWSKKNETAYEEINYVFNYGTSGDTERELAKYKIKYILFDQSIYIPGNPNFLDFLEKQRNKIESLPGVTKEETFGKIIIYKMDLVETNNFVSAPKVSYPTLLEFSQTGRPEITESFSGEQGYKDAENCSIGEVGKVTKSVQSHSYVYKAQNDGVSCDYFYYPSLDYSKGYILRIKGNNIQGRSLKFYLFNVKSGQVDIERLLPAGDFDEYYKIYPTSFTKSVGEGFTLNVETRSFGNFTSENVINVIEFYPVDTTRSQPQQILNNLDIVSVSKFGTWGYKIAKEGKGLLELDQGYEDGWIAFSIDSPTWQMRIYDHKIYNSWSNSWNIDNDAKVIYIFFWPQLLEWGGLILALGSLVFIFKKTSKLDTP